MSAYYNEIDPFAAQWLRNLIDKNLIVPGDVDERSIVDVQPDDLLGYVQCHFFAGIGGWSYALRLAGWRDDEPVWTGSCPCQPFSAAGKRKGRLDERHLWPAWFWLIQQCKPPIIFGEQVAKAIAFGWLDDVYQGMEREGYALGSAVLPAVGVGQAHRRDRAWFVAHFLGGTVSDDECRKNYGAPQGMQGTDQERKWVRTDFGKCGDVGSLALSDLPRSPERCTSPASVGYRNTANADGRAGGIMENSQCSQSARFEQFSRSGLCEQKAEGLTGSSGGCNQRRDFEWLLCGDQKYRPVEPRIPLLAHGVSNVVGKLRGYGNAIVPQVAAEFIRAYMECCP